MVVAVAAVFAVSWLPIQSILLLKSLGLYPVTIPKIIIQVDLIQSILILKSLGLYPVTIPKIIIQVNLIQSICSSNPLDSI